MLRKKIVYLKPRTVYFQSSGPYFDPPKSLNITSVWLIFTGLIWKKVCFPLKKEIKVIICWVIFAISVNYSIKIFASEVSHWSKLSNIIWVVLKVSRNSVVNSCADFCAPNVSKPLKAYRRATASNWYDKQVDKPCQTRSKKSYQYVKLYSFTVRFHQKIWPLSPF